MAIGRRNKHIGSSLEDWFKEESLLRSGAGCALQQVPPRAGIESHAREGGPFAEAARRACAHETTEHRSAGGRPSLAEAGSAAASCARARRGDDHQLPPSSCPPPAYSTETNRMTLPLALPATRGHVRVDLRKDRDLPVVEVSEGRLSARSETAPSPVECRGAAAPPREYRRRRPHRRTWFRTGPWT